VVYSLTGRKNQMKNQSPIIKPEPKPNYLIKPLRMRSEMKYFDKYFVFVILANLIVVTKGFIKRVKKNYY